MRRPLVHVVQTATANSASVLAALRRADTLPVLTREPRTLAQSSRVVLPGVGTFAAAMTHLEDADLVEVLRQRARERRPLLAICLGLQLLGEESEESPGVRGLGLWPLRARALEAGVRVPHLGWNVVEPEPGCRFVERGHAYFANSFALREVPAAWAAARTIYGGSLVAAVESGPVLACQFHPELSGAFGARLIRRWVEGSERC